MSKPLTIADAEQGTLWIEGTRTFDAPLEFPANEHGRPADFAIRGRGVGARLVYTGSVQPAVVIDTRRWPADYPGGGVDRRLQDVQIVGGAVHVTGGGKYVKLRDLDITGVPPTAPVALRIDTFDGGRIEANVHDNRCRGVEITNSHTAILDVTSRVNAGTGIRLDDCTLSGRLYSEANSGLNFDCHELVRSRLDLWNEQAWYADFRAGRAPGARACYGRLRACWGNDFVGQAQDESWQAWDCDAVSRAANRFGSDPGQMGFDQIGIPLNGGPLAGALINYTPEQVAIHGAGHYTLFAGGLQPEMVPGRARYLELRDPTGTMATAEVSAGDWLIVSGGISSPQWEYLAQQSVWPLLRFIMYVGGQPTTLGQNVFVTRPQGCFATAPVPVTRGGRGVRVYVYLDVGIGATLPMPAREVPFALTGFSVRRLAAS